MQSTEFRLRLGETAVVRPGIVRTKVAVVFTGMLSDSVYSLAVLWSYGHNSMAYNLYLQKNQTRVDIPKGKLEILYISKDEIQFRYEEQ